MNNCNNCPVNDGYKPAEAVHEIADPTPSIEAVMHDLRESHARTSKGEWSKGDTTHYTVAKRGDGKEYRIAEFRHADDAQFCDLAHAFVPRLIDEVEAQRARIAELEKENSYMNNACAELEAQLAAAPQAVQAAVPLFWVRLLRDGLYEGPVHNNSASGKLLRDEKPGEWHPLYLHAAPAHHTEAVPAQCPNINEPRGCWRVACQLGGKCREPERSATQPAAQGIPEDWPTEEMTNAFGENFSTRKQAETFPKAFRAALAAAPRKDSTGNVGQAFRCADCKTPLVQGYTCGACGSDLAEDA